MEFTQKQFLLKEGKRANILFAQLPEQYSIFAEDDLKNNVGKLSFEIVSVFSHKLTLPERLEIAAARGTMLSAVEEALTITFTQSNQNMYDIKDDVLEYNGLKYNLKNKYAVLNLIEITDSRYFHVGLGSVMHKIMENFARSQGCKQIRVGMYLPFGEFAHATKPFYENQGYEFEIYGGQKIVFKDLTKISQNQNDFRGTPINRKYLTK